MKQFLSEQEYEALKPGIKAGTTVIQIPRSIARDFFIKVSNDSVKTTTGSSLLYKKLLVWTGVVIPLVLLIVCAGFVIEDFGWASALFIPLIGILWTVIAGLTGDRGSFLIGNLLLIACLLLASLLDRSYGIPLLLISLSLWCHRSIFFLAEYWLKSLLEHSYAAFDMLVEHIEIEKPD